MGASRAMKMVLIAAALGCAYARTAGDESDLGVDGSNSDVWYPNSIIVNDQHDTGVGSKGVECTIDRYHKGEVTLDDVQEGLLCKINRDTGDICLPQYLIDAAGGLDALATMDTAQTHPLSETMKDFVTAVAAKLTADGGIMDGEDLVTVFGGPDGKTFDVSQIPTKSYAQLRVDGLDWFHLKNGYAGVTGFDLRGLTSFCGRIAGTDTNDLLDLWAGSANKHRGELDFNDMGNLWLKSIDNAKFVDVSDLDFASDIVITEMPDVQSVALDSVVNVCKLLLDDLPLIRSIYLPNLMQTTYTEVNNNWNLLDFVAPKLSSIEYDGDPDSFEVGARLSPNLHMIVVGCFADANFPGNDFDPTDPLDYDDEVRTDYLSRNVDGWHRDVENSPTLTKHNTFLTERNPTGHWDWNTIKRGSLQWGVSGKGSVDEGSNTGLRPGEYKDADCVGKTCPDWPTPRGYIEWCEPDKVYQYDRMHSDFVDTNDVTFNINVRCGENRDEAQLAAGNTHVAVVEVMNAVPLKHVTFAWSSAEGDAKWMPSRHCEVETKLDSIHDDHMATRRADPDGYVNYRHYLTDCSAFYYSAVSNPANKECMVARTMFGTPASSEATDTYHHQWRNGDGKHFKMNLKPRHGEKDWPLDEMSPDEVSVSGDEEFWGSDGDPLSSLIQQGPGIHD